MFIVARPGNKFYNTHKCGWYLDDIHAVMSLHFNNIVYITVEHKHIFAFINPTCFGSFYGTP